MSFLIFTLGFLGAWLLLGCLCALAHTSSLSRREEQPPHGFL